MQKRKLQTNKLPPSGLKSYGKIVNDQVSRWFESISCCQTNNMDFGLNDLTY